MDTHGIVGSDGSIDKGPGLVVLMDVTQLLECSVLLPEFEQLSLLGREIDFSRDLLKRHDSSLVFEIREQRVV
jgi:hypothetical protein